MRIKNIQGLSAADLEKEVNGGAKFLYYPYAISLIVITFKCTSGVYLVRANKNAFGKSIPFIILSALFGWWGIPFGPKYTVESIRTNLKGGKNVTEEVMSTVAGHVLFKEAQLIKKSLPVLVLP